jgi:hypothetical protein
VRFMALARTPQGGPLKEDNTRGAPARPSKAVKGAHAQV